MQGKVDINLNQKGIKQAEKTRDYLKDFEIDLILCSPLKRAIQIANIINQEKNVKLIVDERISKRDFGEFDGIVNLDFNFNAFWSYNKNLKYADAENIKDFFERVYSFLNYIKEEYN